MIRRLTGNAALLTTLAVLFWAGNFLLGRAVRADVPPITLAFGRWAGASLLLLPFAGPALWRERHVLRRHLGIVLVLSFLGVAVFNTLIYVGLQTTTALNAFLLQALMPVLIVGLGVLAFRETLGVRQVAGLAISLAGAAWVIVEGDPSRLANLDLTPGDLVVLVAVVAYAGYSVLLRRRPPMSGLAFALATFLIGAAMLVPFWAWESTRQPFEPSWAAVAAFAYLTVFPSIVSFLCFNQGVRLIGSARAGAYLHLMPVLGSVGAVLLLNEAIRSHHVLGVVLVGVGLVLGTRGGRPGSESAAARAEARTAGAAGEIDGEGGEDAASRTAGGR